VSSSTSVQEGGSTGSEEGRKIGKPWEKRREGEFGEGFWLGSEFAHIFIILAIFFIIRFAIIQERKCSF
jgi:hypothetical protein